MIIGRVVFVDLAAQGRQGGSLREPYMRIVYMMTTLLWPAFVGLAVVAGPFILLIYGERWVAAAHPLTMLALAACLLVSISMTWELFVIAGETAAQTKIEVGRSLFSLILFIAMSSLGLTAAAFSRVIDAAVSIFLYRPYLNKITNTRFNALASIYLRSGALTVLAIGPAALYMAFQRFSEHAPLSPLLIFIALGICFWAGGLIALQHPLASEAGRIVARGKRRIYRRRMKAPET